MSKETKKAKTADDKVTHHKPTEKMQEGIDDAIRAAVKKAFGKVVPVCGLLGMRNSNSVKGGAPYQRYYLANGHTVFVSGWHQEGGPRVTVSDEPADKKSYTVAAFLERFKRKEARTDAKAAAKRTAAVPAKAAKIA
jgi:hypothetical protein